jgi:hypothetical protein
MDSLGAQCFLIGLAEGEACVPPLWRHDRSGALSWSFGEGGRWYSWSPDYVVEIAKRWRDSGRNEPPGSVRKFLDAHRRLEEIAGQVGHGNPDAMSTTSTAARSAPTGSSKRYASSWISLGGREGLLPPARA